MGVHPHPQKTGLILPSRWNVRQKVAIATRTVKAVNREVKLSRRYRDPDLAKFESSRRYRER
jgi:hypothetical protein